MKNLPFILSEVDGIVVGWDTCFRCKTHIVRCSCDAGPQRPDYIERWAKNRADNIAKSVTAAHDELPTVPAARQTAGPTERGVVATLVRTGLVCSKCQQPTNEASSDPNDDDTVTCHTCQAQ